MHFFVKTNFFIIMVGSKTSWFTKYINSYNLEEETLTDKVGTNTNICLVGYI
jgi:hypothetical protein